MGFKSQSGYAFHVTETFTFILAMTNLRFNLTRLTDSRANFPAARRGNFHQQKGQTIATQDGQIKSDHDSHRPPKTMTQTELDQAIAATRHCLARHEGVVEGRPAPAQPPPTAINHYVPRNAPQPGEITLKQWVQTEAEYRHTTASAIHNRINRGCYPNLVLRRVNQRVIFVKMNT